MTAHPTVPLLAIRLTCRCLALAGLAVVCTVGHAQVSTDKFRASYDVVIVGSGAGGGQTAYTLTMEGVKVLVLEAGRSTTTTDTRRDRFSFWDQPGSDIRDMVKKLDEEKPHSPES